MLTEEITKEIYRDALAHLAEHPTYGFVHQIVRVMQMDFGIAQAPRGIAHLRSLPRTDDAHALLPKARAFSQRVEEFNFIVFAT